MDHGLSTMDHFGLKVARRYLEAEMKEQDRDPASAYEQADGSSENVNAGAKNVRRGADDFNTEPDLDGKTDSGPEPDVFGREIPPQD